MGQRPKYTTPPNRRPKSNMRGITPTFGALSTTTYKRPGRQGTGLPWLRAGTIGTEASKEGTVAEEVYRQGTDRMKKARIGETRAVIIYGQPFTIQKVRVGKSIGFKVVQYGVIKKMTTPRNARRRGKG